MDVLFSEPGQPGGKPTGIDSELQSLLAKLKAVRGPNDQWIEMENAVSRYIGNLTNNDKVWCRGEIHAKTRHYPAVVICTRDTHAILVMAPSGEDFAMEEHPHYLFSSNIPHIGICREVFTVDGINSTI